LELCCCGTKSDDCTMVGRSHSVTGPYLDRTATTWPPAEAHRCSRQTQSGSALAANR
jgi:hypothetical protein